MQVSIILMADFSHYTDTFNSRTVVYSLPGPFVTVYKLIFAVQITAILFDLNT